MVRLLYENMSPRDDYGVLTWVQGETFSIPFKLNVTNLSGVEYVIKETDQVIVTIKKDRRNIECLYEKIYTQLVNNVILFTVDDRLSKILRKGTYVMNALLKTDWGNIAAINNLPIKITG